MNVADREALARLVDLERERTPTAPPASRVPAEPQTIHHSDLPADPAADEVATEWNVYRREAGRLLTQGHEGRWVLIRGDDIIGIWDTESEARAAAANGFLMQSVLIRRVLAQEPVLRTPTFLYRCRN